MKKFLRILPVIAGFGLALVGSSLSANTSMNNKDDAPAFGFCEGNEQRVCGTTAQGTEVYGRWKEGPGNQQ